MVRERKMVRGDCVVVEVDKILGGVLHIITGVSAVGGSSNLALDGSNKGVVGGTLLSVEADADVIAGSGPEEQVSLGNRHHGVGIRALGVEEDIGRKTLDDDQIILDSADSLGERDRGAGGRKGRVRGGLAAISRGSNGNDSDEADCQETQRSSDGLLVVLDKVDKLVFTGDSNDRGGGRSLGGEGTLKINSVSRHRKLRSSKYNKKINKANDRNWEDEPNL